MSSRVAATYSVKNISFVLEMALLPLQERRLAAGFELTKANGDENGKEQ